MLQEKGKQLVKGFELENNGKVDSYDEHKGEQGQRIGEEKYRYQPEGYQDEVEDLPLYFQA